MSKRLSLLPSKYKQIHETNTFVIHIFCLGHEPFVRPVLAGWVKFKIEISSLHQASYFVGRINTWITEIPLKIYSTLQLYF